MKYPLPYICTQGGGRNSFLNPSSKSVADLQTFVFVFFPLPMDKDTMYYYFLSDSFLKKQSVLLVALVINQGFFLSLESLLAQSLQYM